MCIHRIRKKGKKQNHSMVLIVCVGEPKQNATIDRQIDRQICLKNANRLRTPTLCHTSVMKHEVMLLPAFLPSPHGPIHKRHINSASGKVIYTVVKSHLQWQTSNFKKGQYFKSDEPLREHLQLLQRNHRLGFFFSA